MVIVTGTVQVQPEHLSQALTLCRDHVQRSRGEPGCVSHAVHQDVEDPGRLFFFEQWQDRGRAFEALRGARVRRVRGGAATLHERVTEDRDL